MFAAGLLCGLLLEAHQDLSGYIARADTFELLQRRLEPRPVATGEKFANTLFRVFAPDVEVVMIGDSLTADAHWSEIYPAIRIANRGIRGDAVRDVQSRMSEIIATRPERAFLMIGINDLRRGHSVDETFAAYSRIIDELERSGVSVHVLSTLECSRPVCGELVERVRNLNRLLMNHGRSKGLKFIDLNQAMSDPESGLKSDLTYDGFHLLGSGYRVWSELIASDVMSQSIGKRDPLR